MVVKVIRKEGYVKIICSKNKITYNTLKQKTHNGKIRIDRSYCKIKSKH